MTLERNVGIGQLAIARPPEQLVCLGLGSCVAIVIYDPGGRIGGIVHVLLPRAPAKCDQEEKYADTGTRKLVRELLSRGARKERLAAKLVGGAHMFPNLNIAIVNIGLENVREARRALREHQIKVVAEDIAGSSGRSAYFDSATGRILIKTAFSSDRVI